MASTITRTISRAGEAFKLLNGVVCLYKPLGWSNRVVMQQFKQKITDDLNKMQPPPRQERIEILRLDEKEKALRIPMENEKVLQTIPDGEKDIQIVKGLNYADHPLIAGHRYREEDVGMFATVRTSPDLSGVHLYGLNKGMTDAHLILHGRWLRTYLISGEFGIATDSFFHTGRVLEKATYGSIKRPLFERYLASSESSHQRLSFLSSGVDLDSERAYELASQGLVRPDNLTDTVIYSLKCKELKLPHFTIEVKAINEDPEYLKELIHRIGLGLKTVAVCTKIQCTNVGPFGINEALLQKHWNMENVLSNLRKSQEILKDFDLRSRNPWVAKPLTVEPDEVDDEDEYDRSNKDKA